MKLAVKFLKTYKIIITDKEKYKNILAYFFYYKICCKSDSKT